MRRLLCIDTKDFDIGELVTLLAAKHGLKLAHNPTNIVHGAIFANHFPAGIKPRQAESHGRYWCNEDLPEGEHTCIVVTLYEREERPNAFHETHLVPHPERVRHHQAMKATLHDYLTGKGRAVCHHEGSEIEPHLDFFVPA